MSKPKKTWHQAMAAIGSAKTADQWLRAIGSLPKTKVSD